LTKTSVLEDAGDPLDKTTPRSRAVCSGHM
jgi:hypothetical protein